MLHGLLHKACREQGERLSRSKYNEVAKAWLAYAKQRKPKKSVTRKNAAPAACAAGQAHRTVEQPVPPLRSCDHRDC